MVRNRIEVGDSELEPLTSAGIEHAVVEVVRQTDASGNVTFTTPGISLALALTPTRVLANVNTGLSEGDDGFDPLFGAFVVQITTGPDQGKYLVGVQHPRLGRIRLAPEEPAATLNETITCCWEPGTITVTDGGTPVADKRCSIWIKRETADGAVGGEVDANAYYVLDAAGAKTAGRSGRWVTNGSGVLQDNIEGQALQDLAFPAYPGNTLGTDFQSAVEWAGAARFDTEYGTGVIVYCEGVGLSIGPGVGGTIEIGGGTIACTGGTWQDTVIARLENAEYPPTPPSGLKVTSGCNPSGEATLTGLAEGRYCLERIAGPVSGTGIAKRVWVDVNRGQTTNVALQPLEGPSGTNDFMVRVYTNGADPLGGTDIYQRLTNTVLATTDGAGMAEWEGTDGAIAVNDGGWGVQRLDLNGDATGEVCLGGTLVLVDDPLLGSGGVYSWVGGEADDNLPFPPLSEQTGYYVRRQDNHAITSALMSTASGLLTEDPLQRAEAAVWMEDPVRPGEGEFDVAGITPYTWELCDGFGEVVYSFQLFPSTGNWYDLPAYSVWHSEILGGRVEWSATGIDGQQIGGATGQHEVFDAARMGLTRGEHVAYHELRIVRGSVIVGAFGGCVCPYCYGAGWPWPGQGAALRYGWCQNCANVAAWLISDAKDLRTYGRTAAMGAGAATAIAIAIDAVSGERVRWELPLWPRPVEFKNTATYEITNGRGMTTNAAIAFNADDAPPAPEYHPTLATYTAGAFAQDETGATIRATLGLDADVSVRPIVAVAPGTTHNGETVYRASFSGATTVEFTVPSGMNGRMAPGEFEALVFLEQDPVLEGASALLVTACTDIEVVSGPDTNSIVILADCPGIVESAIPLEDRGQQPVVFWLGGVAIGGGLWLAIDAGGIIWRAHIDGGDVVVSSMDAGQTQWVEAGRPFGPGPWSYPSIICADDGSKRVSGVKDGQVHVTRL